jgi:hypothetical protein
MHKRLVAFAIVVLVVLSALPTDAAGIPSSGKIATALGVRYENAAARLKIGEKTGAIVVDASKLASRQVLAKNGDKVQITLTGERAFSVQHLKSGQVLKYAFTDQGVVSPLP